MQTPNEEHARIILDQVEEATEAGNCIVKCCTKLAEYGELCDAHYRDSRRKGI